MHYVQHVQIYRICEQHTYNFVALKKGGNIVAHTVLVFGMYRKDSLSWIKHTDFIIVDILCLNLSYVLACLLWQGMNRMLYVCQPIESQVQFTTDLVNRMLNGETINEEPLPDEEATTYIPN